MTGSVDLAIIGAGPYGLSLAAHLRAAGVNFRIFGMPMSTWREHMPADMFLKSDGFASNLSDPAGAVTLKKFCEQTGEPYADRRIPVRLATFCAYGLGFQERAVPNLERKWVAGVDQTPRGFELRLDDGELVIASKVVLAVGITHFDFTPPELSRLPRELVSHSSAYGDLTPLSGRSVTIVGRGASACDLAAALEKKAADVTIIARAPVVYFGDPPATTERPLWQRLRHPQSGIGSSLRSKIYADAPALVHYLPQSLRSRIVQRHLGPSASWTVRERVVGKVPLWTGTDIRAAEPVNGKVRLTLRSHDGTEKTHVTDHVVAATGYRVDVRRLAFLSARIRGSLRTVQNSPRLSLRFESSVPGLYFIGVASSLSFGPVMRFAYGADFTARSLSHHLARSSRGPVPVLRTASEQD